MSLRILIATDVFPPVCGGSGWSTYELAKTLRAHGHQIILVQPRIGPASRRRPVEHDGFRPLPFHAPAPDVPYVRNYFKNERLYARLEPHLRELIRRERINLVHAQHVLTSPPSIGAARATGIPVVCTVRDYWPVCYWSDLIHDYASDTLCPGCSPSMMTRCVRPRAGLAWPLALPLIPYMGANLLRKRRRLSEADAIIAVSSTIFRDLRTRAPELARTRMETIPNPIDVAGIRRAAEQGGRPLDTPYAVYVGKLAANKGISKLMATVERARLDWPLIVVGDGPARAAVEAEMRRTGRDVRLTGWLPREEALRWLRHASLLIFPSHWPEPLSRVLLEAAILGVPTAAMDTGGTRDIITDEETGLLSQAVEELAHDVSRLAQDQALRERLGRAASRSVESKFDAPAVVRRIEALYRELVEGRRDGG